MRFAVLGSGSWGTTLANLLAKKGHETRLLVREQELLAEIVSKRENSWYMPGIKLHEGLEASTDPAVVMKDAEVFLCAIPSQFLRSALMSMRDLMPKKPVVLCASKGIELNSLHTMSQVVEDSLASLKPRFAMLSGPSFALEVSRELPTAVTLGCCYKKLGIMLQEALATDYFRVYTTTDYRGVELGGAIKNIIAIAAGIADGLSFGSNARAALITRGLAEMSRLGVAMGAKPATFMGLSGMGDLVLTCTGELSRNRQVGLRLGKGQKLLDILGQMKMVAEGVKTTEAVHGLGKMLEVELPITEQVYEVLYNGKDPEQAVRELMTRELKQEA
ncbi:glycerol 3-phosphate dehydrogenase (NAD(P)+) [Desulfocurvibacter africanus PCS]|uniref:Glycerol-3-phosphate dehydrogenase [NAD(P)+] n=1 Tax=Desulfocurvibacter africanus PCS TaxID=1262666 RepID=M5PRY4_DESAF|nr:NAD(P)H-dependent glycerol-3-phosphate dehydrogenase [Desulfocurvibacter africanus]EMG36894.1 glycerol 3-phosphate dehydrogenase (NAD(P)+) [Desulfocurvibacter africanus PCS]